MQPSDANPFADPDVRAQMEALKDVEADVPSLEKQAQAAAERTGSNVLTQENAPELFKASSGQPQDQTMTDLLRAIEELPRRIAEELRR